MSEKERLDVLLAARGLAHSREAAKALIMSGEVYVDGQRSSKPGHNISVASEIEVKGVKPKYVSRGGFKLEKAMETFSISLSGKICADIGASTGGFTDCMLKNGAERVYSVDVGYGQLDWNLRNDNRVVVMEKTNARYLKYSDLGEGCGFASVDVAFISLLKILPVFVNDDGILTNDGESVCLIKPQFECGRKYVGKKGVVKDKFVHSYVIAKIVDNAREMGLYTKQLTYSPIKGPNGNIEYLIHLVKCGCQNIVDAERLVNEAHEAFEGAKEGRDGHFSG